MNEELNTGKKLAEPGQFLSFTLRNRPYAVPIGKVKEINQITEITPVPEAANFVEGVLNLRGKIIPVVDLGSRFNLAASERTKETCVIVIESHYGLVGMIVDTVREVVDLAAEGIQPPPNVGQTDSAQYISGMGQVKDEVYILLDIEHIFDFESLQELVEAKEAS